MDSILTGGYARDVTRDDRYSIDEGAYLDYARDDGSGELRRRHRRGYLLLSDPRASERAIAEPLSTAASASCCSAFERGSFLYCVVASSPVSALSGPSVDAVGLAMGLFPSTVHELSLRISMPLSPPPETSIRNKGVPYPLQIGDYTSTNAGGADGCLKWDGGANNVKIELETLKGIDAVEVTREILPPLTGGVGAGAKYHVTVTGVNGRGNVPPRQSIDVGSNGCLSAHSLGGIVSDDITLIAVEQIESPYVLIYKIQTTTDIPYDATSADMKAAHEALSQACTVDVSRKVNCHGYSWDVTFVGTEGNSYSPLLALSANGAPLSAEVDPGVSVVDIQHIEVPASTGGTPIFIRVAAVNSFGMGPFTLSIPRPIEVSNQPPSEPIDVFAEATSQSSILVQWNPPKETGGRPISHYKIEYDKLPSFTGGQNSGPFGSVLLSSSSLGAISDVQSVTVKINNEGLPSDKEIFLLGTFSLAFDGQKTDQLRFNASPGKVKSALEALCNLEEVRVTRSIHCSHDPSIGCMTPEGFTWLITFVSLKHMGNQHYRPTSMLSSHASHRLSVDGSYLFECSDVLRATGSIGGKVVANIGTVQEVQEIHVASSPFSVTIGGETSEVINIGDSLSVVEEKLNAYTKNEIGKILDNWDADFELLGSGPTSHPLLWLANMSLAISAANLARSGTLSDSALAHFSRTPPMPQPDDLPNHQQQT